MSVEDAINKLEGQVTGNTTGDTPVAVSVTPQATEAPDGDTWYDSLDDTSKTALSAYVGNETAKLKTTLDKEREERKALAKQIKELSSKPVDDTAWKAKIEEINTQLGEASLKASFYESAADMPQLPAKRYAAAYKIAKLDGLISDDGEVDWKALQEQHDYLFSAVSTFTATKPGSAGSGLGQKPQPTRGMNDLIRGGR